MTQTAADTLIETLIDFGVDVVFGLPGDGINGIMEALRIREEKIRFIQVRHESRRRSWPARTQSTRGASACVSRRRGRAASIC